MKLSQISELFEQAILIQDQSEQRAFIEKSCPDPEARKKLFDLVLADTETCAIVDEPDAISVMAKAMDTDNNGPREGSVIGNYRLLQEIGEGGMGQVFMADQLEPIRRRVAIKIIKADISSRHILARFEAEREALSRLDHPNITRIMDAGVTDCGLPYFVMELVKGDSLSEYCDRNKLTVRTRVELLEKVCLAVHHAHQKGILHRDLKPSNIMVTMHDGVAVPKVIDFGIAKALDQPLTQGTLFTRYGDMVGTPQYMSPEQAEKSGLDIDSRTDVFSLGVVMYELLTGSTPIEAESLKDKGFLGVLETIRDCDTESPSNRLTRTLTLDQNMAVSRGTDGSLLKRLLRGELDWITMKALSKDRKQRYDSAAAMAKDLRCYLNGEPVTAAAPTFVYHAKKLFQRHRAICLALATAAMLLVVTSLVSLNWALSNSRLTAEITEKSDRLEKLNSELETARDQAREAESKALALANEKRKQAAFERAMSRFMMEEFSGLVAGSDTSTRVMGSEQLSGLLKIISQEKNDGEGVDLQDLPVVSEIRVSGSVPSLPEIGGFLGDLNGFATPFGYDKNTQEKFCETLIEEYRAEFGSHPAVADALLGYCEMLLSHKPANWAKIESRTRESISLIENANASTKEITESELTFLEIKSSCLLAKALKGQGRTEEAEQHLKKCKEDLEQAKNLSDMQRENLAKLLESTETVE